MSINLLSKLISSCIALLLIFITAFIVWAWQEMDKPYTINQSYHSIKAEIESDIALSLEQYLSTGNASKLRQAENQLAQLKSTPIRWLNDNQKRTINHEISQLQLAIQQARGAGKLAANPAMLLINNETERVAAIEDL